MRVGCVLPEADESDDLGAISAATVMAENNTKATIKPRPAKALVNDGQQVGVVVIECCAGVVCVRSFYTVGQ